jgi:hypothetical protein
VSPLVDTMRRILGARFNPELEGVYTRAFGYVVDTLGKAFDEGVASKTNNHNEQQFVDINLDRLLI